jgi:hypothetical protein
MYLGEGVLPAPPVMGVIVKMHIGNGANVAWFADDMRVTWVPLLELEVISEMPWILESAAIPGHSYCLQMVHRTGFVSETLRLFLKRDI